MQLWATGFNAWNQLNFQRQTEDISTNPQDVLKFRPVLVDDYIDILRTSLSSILVKTSSGLVASGTPDSFIAHCIKQQDPLEKVAVAFNDKIATCINGTLTEFPNLSAYIARTGIALRPFDRLQQLVANTTTFTALSSTGSVYTWGDPRYETCLARKTLHERSASQPCLVEDLLDLPTGKICKLASGGYHTAALTTGSDIYLWGGRPGQPKLLDQLEDYPTPVDVDGVDWADVSIGHDHIVALSTDGDVWVAGESGNGQLGLGERIDAVRGWKKVDLDLEGWRVSQVFAGYKNSFLVLV